jgi:O-antigen/teichoic acid export membrane protein
VRVTAIAILRSRAPSGWRSEISAMAPRLAGTLGTSGISAALGILSGTIAARMLGPATRGELAQLLLWPQMVVTVGSMGIELAAVYLSGDTQKRRDVPATLMSIAMVQSVILIGAYLALIPIVYRDPALMRESLAMIPLIPMYLTGAVAIDCLAGRLRFVAFNAVRITLPALYCTALIALAAADELTPMSAALAYLAAHAAADVIAVVLVLRDGGPGSFSTPLAREAGQYGLRAHFGRLTPQSLGIDTAILALLLASDDVGLYVAATAFLAAPGLVASSVGMVVFPQVSATHQAGERPRLHATFILYASVVMAIAAALFVAAPTIVTLFFGEAFADSATALRWLSIASVALALRSFPVDVLRGVGRPGLTSIAEAANWALFLAIVPACAYFGGVTGTAAGVAIASMASLGVLAMTIARTGVFRAEVTPARVAAEAS